MRHEHDSGKSEQAEAKMTFKCVFSSSSKEKLFIQLYSVAYVVPFEQLQRDKLSAEEQ